MLSEREVINTLNMLRNEHLDVRTVTLGVSLFDCVSHDIDLFTGNVKAKLHRYASQLVNVCNEVGDKYGIPVVNKRISVSPIAVVGAPFGPEGMVRVCQALDEAAKEAGVDFLGGFSALVEKGFAKGDRALIEALPEALASTDRICSSINVASSRSGINMDAVALMGEQILKVAQATADRGGLGCAKLVVFANIPQDVPFMAGAYLGVGEPDVVINVGVSGPGVVKKAIDRALEHSRDGGKPMTLLDVAEVIKRTAYKVTRVGEMIGTEVAQRLGLPFGVADLSLAPTPAVGDSVGEIFQSVGLSSIGAPGTTAVLAMLNDAVKKGGAFASSSVGGLSGAFIPVSEDSSIEAAATSGLLSLEKLEAMTSVCSVGLDMIAIPGDTPASTISGLIADEMAIGMINHKTTAVRVIPVPGKGVGEEVSFGGLLGKAAIIPVPRGDASAFIGLGGRIPAPIHSLKN
ncbi:PFL family protein [uncultured Desulfovibrio sp.]|uniref:PFL family protein n=1 Tax=uncultured Desulfovibrio sp. TaxID=167968 RepID=UPI002611C3AA|nr:PFL family protein [uncultured Desulfovibrio sp.]